MNGVLRGRRVVNTRAAHQAAELDALLQERGAVSVPYPCIVISPPDDCQPLDAALHALVAGHFDWLALTSVNAVDAIADRLDRLELDLSRSPIQIAAVGTATAHAAERRLQHPVAFRPREQTGQALGATLPLHGRTRVLFPGSTRARPDLARALLARGATVTRVVAYQTDLGSGGAAVPELIAKGQIDALTFTSPSTVTGFRTRLEQEHGSWTAAVAIPAVCLGPTTCRAATGVGLPCRQPDGISGLVGLLCALERALDEGGTG